MRGKDRDFTSEEYFELGDRLQAADERGDEEEFVRLAKMYPVSPTAARAFAKVYGKDFVEYCGFDLTEANIKYGEGWLDAFKD